MRYSLWALAAICIGVLIYTFITTMNGEVSATVPKDYRFAVTNNYSEGSKIRTTYYVYDDKILVEDESFEKSEVDRSVMIYDGINTTSLKYDPSDIREAQRKPYNAVEDVETLNALLSQLKWKNI